MRRNGVGLTKGGPFTGSQNGRGLGGTGNLSTKKRGSIQKLSTFVWGKSGLKEKQGGKEGGIRNNDKRDAKTVGPIGETLKVSSWKVKTRPNVVGNGWENSAG